MKYQITFYLILLPIVLIQTNCISDTVCFETGCYQLCNTLFKKYGLRDCKDQNEMCLDPLCYRKCTSDADCKRPFHTCHFLDEDKKRGYCYACLTDQQCADTHRCQGHKCIPKTTNEPSAEPPEETPVDNESIQESDAGPEQSEPLEIPEQEITPEENLSETNPEQHEDTLPETTCTPGTTRSCYTAQNGCTAKFVCTGVCKAGKERCSNSGQWSGTCSGQVIPTSETCDQLDNNCDGIVDNNLKSCNTAEVLITPKKFTMGSPSSEKGRTQFEAEHDVTLTQDYVIFKYEVTQQVYQTITKNNPSNFANCTQCPVEKVTWHQALDFANKLSQKYGYNPCYTCSGSGTSMNCILKSAYLDSNYYTCSGYRLPSEAEWEYAARAGSSTAFYNGDITQLSGNDPALDLIGWYSSNAQNKTHAVGLKTPNSFGLYDMIGNVWEWTFDNYQKFSMASVTDPVQDDGSDQRVLRGGAWNELPASCRSASRTQGSKTASLYYIGFRVVRTLP